MNCQNAEESETKNLALLSKIGGIMDEIFPYAGQSLAQGETKIIKQYLFHINYEKGTTIHQHIHTAVFVHAVAICAYFGLVATAPTRST